MCGKPGCLECSGVPGRLTPMGNRNNKIEGYTDRDTGPNTTGEAVEPLSAEKVVAFFEAMQARYARMTSDQLFDFSHPVDEYGPQGGNAVITNTVSLQPDYDMPEKIDGVLVIIPVGATAASLQLGQRILNLYTGAALTTPLIPVIPAPAGIILNSDDPRILSIAGTLTSAPYLGLTGFAVTRGQFS